MNSGEPRVLGEGRFLRLVDRHGWEYVERRNTTGIVVVVAVTPADEIVFVEQHRAPVGSVVVELPAGLAGDISGTEEESLEEAARRELVEETGYDARHLERLMSGPVSAGLSSELVTLFIARDAVKVGEGGGDQSEKIDVHVVPLAHAESWLATRRQAGAMIDAKVYAGLWFAERARRSVGRRA